ncbi:MAG: 16S rRNA (guanine(527)-N(7))-methyltransferase RsmG [Thermoguttaceae bacterium]
MTRQKEDLPEACARHKIELPEAQLALLRQYCELLWQWNAKINLTRHTDYEKFVSRDLLDSLAFAEFLKSGENVLDVGTGGGVPGVLLLILRPDLKVSLSDSVGKKIKALSDIVRQLKLDVPVLHAHAQDLLIESPKINVEYNQQHKPSPRAAPRGLNDIDYPRPNSQDPYNTLVIRAVAPLKKLLHWFQPHWHSFDRMLILKGPAWVQERAEARHLGLLENLALRKLKSYAIPGSEAQSVLLQICPPERLEK